MRDLRFLVRRGFPRCVLALACAACATPDVDPGAEQSRARALIAESTGASEIEAALAPEEIDAALSDGLGLEEALRIALADNRRLQAGFAELGVARADFVQAGLLENPTLSLAFLVPSGGGREQIGADLVQDVLAMWELPRRREIAEAELQRAVLDLSRRAGELVADTELAYYQSVAARELASIAAERADVARATLDAARIRVREGVANAIEESLAETEALEARLAAHAAERDSHAAARRLGALLSLDRDLAGIELTDALPEPVAHEWERELLVERGHSSRLDLRASERSVARAQAEYELESRNFGGGVRAGVGLERPESGSSVDLLAGPELELEVPLFDRNRVQARRAAFRRDALRREHEALAAEIAHEVRAAADRAASAARTARFAVDELEPQARRGAELARTSFDLGRTTLLPLLRSRIGALDARRSRTEAFLEAARARVELERAVGGPLGGS